MIRNTSSNRKSFNSHFDKLLSKELQSQGIKCWLRDVNNYFRSCRNPKRKTYLWSGKYVCVDKKCLNKFTAFIKNSNLDEELKDMNEVTIHVICPVSSHIEKVKPKIRCSGNDRDYQKLLLCSNGLTNSQNENVLQNYSSNENGDQFLKLNFLN